MKVPFYVLFKRVPFIVEPTFLYLTGFGNLLGWGLYIMKVVLKNEFHTICWNNSPDRADSSRGGTERD